MTSTVTLCVQRCPTALAAILERPAPTAHPHVDAMLSGLAELTGSNLQAPRSKMMIYPFYVLFGTTMAGKEALQIR